MDSSSLSKKLTFPLKACLRHKESGQVTELVNILKDTRTTWLVEQPRSKKVHAFAKWAWEIALWN